MSMKNSNDTIWNRTSDLPICSTATITTVPPRPLFTQELVTYKTVNRILSCRKDTELLLNCIRWFCLQPMLVTARSNECFCGRSLGEIDVSNPAEGTMSISCEWCVLSGRDICDGPIPSPEVSYSVRLCMYGVWSSTTITSTPTISEWKEVKTNKERLWSYWAPFQNVSVCHAHSFKHAIHFKNRSQLKYVLFAVAQDVGGNLHPATNLRRLTLCLPAVTSMRKHWPSSKRKIRQMAAEGNALLVDTHGCW